MKRSLHCPQSEGCVTRREMSKWIRERMRRRRKKPGSSGQKGETPPPLQPNFMSGELAPEAPEAEPQPVEAPPSVAPPAEAASSGVEGQAPAGRRRRRRGRRGRGGRGAGTAAKAAPLQPAYPQPIQPAASAAEPVMAEAEPVLATQAVAPASHAAAPAPPPRHKKGTVVLAIGLPGSGKSTWFKRHGAWLEAYSYQTTIQAAAAK